MLGRNMPIQRQSRELTLANAKRKIMHLASSLKLGSQHVEAAFRFYMLAIQHNFTQGRRTQNVAAACLYIVCRRQKTPHMLIDFSDVLQVNMYLLGHTFLKLCIILNIQPPLIDPSLYIDRFVAQLKIEEKQTEVANTALRLIQRMKRDWIQIGRRPAGVCGAALYLACRIHGFKISQKEIVELVKICDSTLKKRLLEFSLTPSSSIPVENFMKNVEDDNIFPESNPPSFNKKTTKKHKKQELQINSLDLKDNEAMKEEEVITQMNSALENGRVFEKMDKQTLDQSPFLKDTNETNPLEQVLKKEIKFENDADSDSCDIDDAEIQLYINTEEQTRVKMIIWDEMNKDYLQQEALKKNEPEATKKKPRKSKSLQDPQETKLPKPKSSKINWDAINFENMKRLNLKSELDETKQSLKFIPNLQNSVEKTKKPLFKDIKPKNEEIDEDEDEWFEDDQTDDVRTKLGLKRDLAAEEEYEEYF